MMDIEQLGRIASWLVGLLHWTGESLAMDGTRLCLLAAAIAVCAALQQYSSVLYTRGENGHERTSGGHGTACIRFWKGGHCKGFFSRIMEL